MSDPKDVIGKADAFLSRYRPGRPADDLPVLTDVVDLTAANAMPTQARGQAAPPRAVLSEAELRSIERQVIQRVLEAIQPHIASFLESSLRAALQERLGEALGPLAEQCKADVESIVRETLSRAVERETAELLRQQITGR